MKLLEELDEKFLALANSHTDLERQRDKLMTRIEELEQWQREVVPFLSRAHDDIIEEFAVTMQGKREEVWEYLQDEQNRCLALIMRSGASVESEHES